MTEPRWLTIARAEIGVKEIAGAADNPRILEYHTTTTLRAREDEVPWCSSFVNWCLQQAGIVGTRSAAAASWEAWGAACGPTPGAIVVIRHIAGPDGQATGSGSGNHVGFWTGADLAHIKLLGGNQSDAVKESLFPLSKYRIVAYRWPGSQEGRPVENSFRDGESPLGPGSHAVLGSAS